MSAVRSREVAPVSKQEKFRRWKSARREYQHAIVIITMANEGDLLKGFLERRANTVGGKKVLEAQLDALREKIPLVLAAIKETRENISVIIAQAAPKSDAATRPLYTPLPEVVAGFEFNHQKLVALEASLPGLLRQLVTLTQAIESLKKDL